MYIQGFLIAVPKDNKEKYRKMAAEAGDYFQSLGASEIVESWEADIQDGKHTDFRRATKATKDEQIVFSWVIWTDKKTCDDAADRMKREAADHDHAEMPFDGKRAIIGGFEPIYTLGR